MLLLLLRPFLKTSLLTSTKGKFYVLTYLEEIVAHTHLAYLFICAFSSHVTFHTYTSLLYFLCVDLSIDEFRAIRRLFYMFRMISETFGIFRIFIGNRILIPSLNWKVI